MHERHDRCRAYRIGSYVVDLALHELRHQGARRALPSRAFDLLVLLIEARDRVVTARELRAAIEAGASAHIDGGALDYSIKAARRALGDDGRSPRAIASVRGRGYRFVAPVEELREGPLPAEDGRSPVAVCPTCGCADGRRCD